MMSAHYLNQRLAKLKGYTDLQVIDGKLFGQPAWWHGLGTKLCPVPDWAGDWAACGPLMERHECYPEVDRSSAAPAFVVALWDRKRKWSSTSIKVAEFPDRGAAARAVVVLSVIEKLESER
jgi:hypothetical protein